MLMRLDQLKRTEDAVQKLTSRSWRLRTHVTCEGVCVYVSYAGTGHVAAWLHEMCSCGVHDCTVTRCSKCTLTIPEKETLVTHNQVTCLYIYESTAYRGELVLQSLFLRTQCLLVPAQ
jgi:hypothetical protein